MKAAGKWAVLACSAAIAGVSIRILVVHEAARADVPGSTVRSAIDLTIYSDDFGMIHEVRPQKLTQGDNHLRVAEVSRELDPQSVSLDWKGQGALPLTVAQAYDLGSANQDDLTKRFVGKQVEVVRYGQNGLEADRQKGELVLNGSGGFVLQSGGSLYVDPPGTIVAPASSDIVTIPQLSVQADSQVEQSADLNVTYLTRGISWSADYVATLRPSDDSLSLDCWASVVNKTGIDYPGAHVSLVAGSPNRAAKSEVMALDMEEAKAPASRAGMDGHRMGDAGGAAFGAPVSVGEMHAYPIAKPTNVIQQQINRILMLSSKSVAVAKDYNTRPPDISGWDDAYFSGQASASQRGTVAVSMTFFNTVKNGLGVPLPHGDLRVYEPGESGQLAYVGAASITDTPDSERVDVTLGTAFDLYTERRIVKREKVAKHVIHKTVELKLHNQKAVDVKLRVVQGFGGRWKIVQEPIKHSNLSSSEAQWIVPVKAHSTLNYQFIVELNV